MLGEASKRSFSNLTMKGKNAVRTWPAKLQDSLHVPTFYSCKLRNFTPGDDGRESDSDYALPLIRIDNAGACFQCLQPAERVKTLRLKRAVLLTDAVMAPEVCGTVGNGPKRSFRECMCTTGGPLGHDSCTSHVIHLLL